MNIFKYFTPSGSAEYVPWYELLEKPFFAPPSWVFGVAWGIIYPLIAIAFILSLVYYFRKKVEFSFIAVFIANLVANVAFTPIQFGLRNNLFSAIDILIVLGTLIYIEKVAWSRSKIVFFLLLPYLLWGAFATVLQLSITYLNW